MADVQWERYPHVAALSCACTWLTIQSRLGLAAATLDAYGRALQDYLTFCAAQQITPEAATREHIAAYVHTLLERPHRAGQNIVQFESGAGLANATIQQRLVAVRLFYDYLVEEGQRDLNPVGRGRYTAGKGFGGKREKGLVPHYTKLPWIHFRCCEKRRKKRSPEGVSVYSTLYFSFCTYLTISKSRWKDNKYFWLSTTSVGGS